MITWKLWRAICNPPRHYAVYQRVLDASVQPMPWYTGCVAIALLPFVLLVGLVLTSTLYSLRWALSASATLADERESGMFELLSLSPAGAFGVAWSVWTATIYRNEALQQVGSIGFWFMRLLCVLLVAWLFDPLGLVFSQFESALVPVYYLLLLCVALYIDYVHSILVGALVSILVGSAARTRFDGGAVALGFYLTLQMIAYFIMAFLALVILPIILSRVGSFFALVTYPVLVVVLFFMIREVVLQGLWRLVSERLNVSPDELQTLSTNRKYAP